MHPQKTTSHAQKHTLRLHREQQNRKLCMQIVAHDVLAHRTVAITVLPALSGCLVGLAMPPFAHCESWVKPHCVAVSLVISPFAIWMRPETYCTKPLKPIILRRNCTVEYAQSDICRWHHSNQPALVRTSARQLQHHRGCELSMIPATANDGS